MNFGADKKTIHKRLSWLKASVILIIWHTKMNQFKNLTQNTVKESRNQINKWNLLKAESLNSLVGQRQDSRLMLFFCVC